MKKLVCLLTLLIVTLFAPRAFAECTDGVCVAETDLKTFVQLAKDRKCRQETTPKLQLDSVTIVVDKDGRIYTSGDEPLPYKFHMEWCNYTLDGTGKVSLVAAQHIDREWGFRFRPKFSAGFLFIEAFHQKNTLSAVDVGVLWEGFYYKFLNLNLATGLRSSGVGLGFDLVKNVTLYTGYAVAYEGLRSNPYMGIGFALW